MGLACGFCAYLSEKTGKPLRLPSEEEWMRLRDAEPRDLQDSAHGPGWDIAPGNVNLEHWATPCPVDMFQSPNGVCDVLGNVWQHSPTPMDVLKGFKTHPLYDDFTVPAIDGFHARILGGSFISTGTNGATRDARFSFRKHFYQHAGFRYVESELPVMTDVVSCETDRTICNALRFHFDAPLFGGHNFSERLAAKVAEVWNQEPAAAPLGEIKALELGCGPGRTVLELSKQGVGKVHGADSTAKAFQRTAQELLQGRGMLRWNNYMEGDLVDRRELVASEVLPLSKADIEWHQMPDFAAIDQQKFRDYDLVVCAQPGALCTSDPVKLLRSAHHLLRPGGLLVVGTQYEWPADGAIVGAASGEEVVARLLESWFETATAPSDLAFAKAEAAREFGCGRQHLTFWRRRLEERSSSSSIAVVPVAQAQESAAGQAVHSSDNHLSCHLNSHFGAASDYPVACADLCVQAMKALNVPMKRALEVGSGPGRAALQLSQSFEHVDAGDSQSFVNLSQKLLTDGHLRWNVAIDATSGTTAEKSISIGELGHVGSIKFLPLEAHNMPSELTGYDLVCGFNLIDRLAKPKQFMESAHVRLNPGGLLVLSSPYTWLEGITEKEEWLGAFKYGDNDGPSSYEGLKEFLLALGFEEAQAPQDVWMRVDELDNGRKSQQTCAQMTFWRRL